MSAPVGKFFDKYIFIMLENNDYDNVMSNAYYNELAQQAVTFTDYHGAIHPSQPNYWSTVSQSTHREASFVSGNQTVFINGANGDDNFNLTNQPLIADSLEAAGLSWAIYSENYPYNTTLGCYTGDAGTEPNVTNAEDIGATNRLYKRKHNPFMSFTQINTNNERCNAHIMSDNEFKAAVAADTFPDYVYFVPNQLDDAHDFNTTDGIGFSAGWLKNFLPQIQNSPSLNAVRTLIHITWDEDDTAYSLYYNPANLTNGCPDLLNCPGDTTNNLVYNIFLGSAVSCYTGTTVSGFYDHTSIVATLEENWGLPPINPGLTCPSFPLKNCPVLAYSAPAAGVPSPSPSAPEYAPPPTYGGGATSSPAAKVILPSGNGSLYDSAAFTQTPGSALALFATAVVAFSFFF